MKNTKMEERIRKLLRLAEGSTYPHEAEAALLKAQELMAMHSISVSASGEAVEDKIIDHEIIAGIRLEVWKRLLGAIIAENFRCYSYFTRGRRRTALYFFGRREDVSLSSAVYHSAALGAMGCWEKWRRDQARACSRSDRKGFLTGFCYGLREKFELQKEAEEEWALALTVDEGVRGAFSSLGCKGKKDRNAVNPGSLAYSSGYAKGLEHHLGNQKILGSRA